MHRTHHWIQRRRCHRMAVPVDLCHWHPTCTTPPCLRGGRTHTHMSPHVHMQPHTHTHLTRRRCGTCPLPRQLLSAQGLASPTQPPGQGETGERAPLHTHTPHTTHTHGLRAHVRSAMDSVSRMDCSSAIDFAVMDFRSDCQTHAHITHERTCTQTPLTAVKSSALPSPPASSSLDS